MSEKSKSEDKVSAARSVAFDLLRAVLTKQRPLEEAMAAHDGFRILPDRDRGFARKLTATVLRRLGQVDFVIDQFLERPLPERANAVRDILRLGTVQLLFFGTGAHAAVDSAVTLTESRGHTKFKGLVNAVLRRISERGEVCLAAAPETMNISEWLTVSWTGAYGEEAVAGIAASFAEEPPLDITVKSDLEGWAEKLEAQILPTGTLRRAFDGPVSGMAGYSEGGWWVQDAAAALPAKLLGDIDGKSVVDLCAAPGGKTAQLVSAGATVIAVDRSAKRLKTLEGNLARLGLGAGTVAADATQWQPTEQVDAVLLDAPCSATGTLRRHPDIPHLKSPSDVAKLSGLQARLIDASIAMLKPGGVLIYATCSIQPEEGESLINNILADDIRVTRKPVTAEEVGGLAELINGDGDLRVLPGHGKDIGGFDGFFAARLVKN